MTADDRRRIREAIDAYVRNRRNIFISADEVIVCPGCGCDSDLYTTGCKRCYDRHQRRGRWARDEAYRVRQNEARKERRRKAREQTAAT